MAPAIIGTMIPIIALLVTGLILVTYFYFRSRERQMLIDKGLDAQSIKEYFDKKADPYRMLKIGIISIGFGIGLGLGIFLAEKTDDGFWVVLLMFPITGISFIVANLFSNKLLKQNS